ncbi:MAG: hypothetical protein JXR42_05485 [Gammaproteobacteria bacterium]|nr:hypothetical protein [Gammaproteobacteria bacterium]
MLKALFNITHKVYRYDFNADQRLTTNPKPLISLLMNNKNRYLKKNLYKTKFNRSIQLNETLLSVEKNNKTWCVLDAEMFSQKKATIYNIPLLIKINGASIEIEKTHLVAKARLNRTNLEHLTKSSSKEHSFIQIINGIKLPELIITKNVGSTHSSFIIMPKLPGISLLTYLNENKIKFQQRINIIVLCLQQLKRIHALNYIHGDLKLGNFLYDKESNSIALIDFEGVQKIGETMQGGTITWEYATPEYLDFRINNNKQIISASFDVYCLAPLLGKILDLKLADILGERKHLAQKLLKLKYTKRSQISDKKRAEMRKDLMLQLNKTNIDFSGILNSKVIPEEYRQFTHELLNKMISPDPKNRPDIDQLLKFFAQFIAT